MTAMALLRALRASGAVCVPWIDHVRITAPPGAPCPALLRELLDLLEEYGERAALAEYSGGVPRAEAEALAWQTLCDHEALVLTRPSGRAQQQQRRCLTCGRQGIHCHIGIPDAALTLAPDPGARPLTYWLCPEHHKQVPDAERRRVLVVPS